MTEQVQAQPSTLEFTDIDNATRIIKAAIERGTFQAEEMSGVAAVYDKFRAFRDEVVASQQAQAAPQEGDVVDPADDAEVLDTEEGAQ